MKFEDLLDILYEDNHCIALNKPAGWPTTHFDGIEETFDRIVKDYIREKYNKPGNVFLGVVHRLDKPVSGALLFARTSKAAARLSEQFRENSIEKVYWAVVESKEPLARGERFDFPQWGTLEHWLKTIKTTGKVEIVEPETPEGRPSILFYSCKAIHNDTALIELRPQTGRRHQLRVQMSSMGHPIFGDRKYGARHRLGVGIGLHARSLTFLHPTRHEPITITADVPKHWRGQFAYLLKGLL